MTEGFNEAEARTPRMARCRRIVDEGVGSFNEAEARTPRMDSGCVADAGYRYRFNEAEARTPRMARRRVDLRRLRVLQ